MALLLIKPSGHASLSNATDTTFIFLDTTAAGIEDDVAGGIRQFVGAAERDRICVAGLALWDGLYCGDWEISGVFLNI